MDGLVKNLVDLALGHPERGDDRDERDERSRSTWSQVVSGGWKTMIGSVPTLIMTLDVAPADRLFYLFSSSLMIPFILWRNIRDITAKCCLHGLCVSVWQEERYGRNEWESGESQPTMRPQKDGGANNDGWETVHKKPSKQHHKVNMDQRNSYKRPIHEQEYSSDVDYGVNLEPTEEELADLSTALNKLWKLDLNRLVPGKDYEIDCGEGKKVYQKGDMAEGSLFSWLSEDIFRRPTFSRFCSLLDNYNPHEGYKEVVTAEERQEQEAFIEEISRTAPIKYLYKYLLTKGIAPESYQDFKRMMASLWFDLYGRGGTSSSSSAFEHVFVGEIKQRREQEVSGFHNWIQVLL
ncbi:UNVERIFIED_CONTAM: hypothetical protein Sradi_6686000 [Sesamum radiatum]|uniref:EndoU domain-containing protein n=1 Tax=Sesamum radiatum TaxID=300843 RepID=A0AAW2JPI0_SESRA